MVSIVQWRGASGTSECHINYTYILDGLQDPTTQTGSLLSATRTLPSAPTKAYMVAFSFDANANMVYGISRDATAYTTITLTADTTISIGGVTYNVLIGSVTITTATGTSGRTKVTMVDVADKIKAWGVVFV